jgi:hypothetical protein
MSFDDKGGRMMQEGGLGRYYAGASFVGSKTVFKCRYGDFQRY